MRSFPISDDATLLGGDVNYASSAVPRARTLTDTLGTTTSASATPPRHRSKVLAFAWGVEIIAVTMGLILAVFAGIEGSDGGPLALAIACLPFMALSTIELTKIPLVGLAFEVRSLVWRMLAIIALLFVTGATFENFVFGFERGFNERIRAAETADQAVRNKRNEAQLAGTEVLQLQARQKDIEQQLVNLDKEMTASRDQAKTDIADAHSNDSSAKLRDESAQLQTALSQAEQRHTREINSEWARCHASQTKCNFAGINGKWNKQRDQITKQLAQISEQEQAEHGEATHEISQARAKRDADLGSMTEQRETLQHQLDDMRVSLAEAQTQVLHSDAAIADAERARDILIERSQLHRLSDVIFGNHERASLETTKKIFVVSLAAIVAVIGSVIATMYYAAQTATAHPPRRPLVNAIRGYLARRRARIPVVRDVREAARQRNRMARTIRSYFVAKRVKLIRKVSIIKEVPVDRLKIVFLPSDVTEEEVAQARAEAMRASRPAVSVPPTAPQEGEA